MEVAQDPNLSYSERQFDAGKLMRVILLGGPGAGKGTQAVQISKHFCVPQISTGDMLRVAVREGTELGLKAKAVMDSGTLVSDDIILDLIKERIVRPDCCNGFLFDGFPRTIPQAQALRSQQIKLDCVLEISVSDEQIIHRMSGRRVHLESGRTYHVVFNPPKVPGIDDVTGEPLIQRDDDKEITVKKRLAVYHEQTQPLVNYFQEWSKTKDSCAPSYFRIDGAKEVESVTEEILEVLKRGA